MPRPTPKYTCRIAAPPISLSSVNTSSCFNVGHQEIERSPIDNCLDKISDLNLILVKFKTLPNLSREILYTQNNLVLLGYISAVESYLREVIRKLILIDKTSKSSCLQKFLSYGAAINYSEDVLPEALLEICSFASKANIIETFKGHLGLKGQQPSELIEALDEFETICHLRHCVVHRFGKLGSNNAIKFGIETHRICLEKPLALEESQMYDIVNICENTVLVINHYLFTAILMRTVENNEWNWDLRKDKYKFSIYYDLFYSNLKSIGGMSLNKAYNELRLYKANL